MCKYEDIGGIEVTSISDKAFENKYKYVCRYAAVCYVHSQTAKIWLKLNPD